jgi:stress response protein YsnF
MSEEVCSPCRAAGKQGESVIIRRRTVRVEIEHRSLTIEGVTPQEASPAVAPAGSQAITTHEVLPLPTTTTPPKETI